jgi:hypothetical protein
MAALEAQNEFVTVFLGNAWTLKKGSGRQSANCGAVHLLGNCA